jgi:hypothetical protein
VDCLLGTALVEHFQRQPACNTPTASRTPHPFSALLDGAPINIQKACMVCRHSPPPHVRLNSASRQQSLMSPNSCGAPLNTRQPHVLRMTSLGCAGHSQGQARSPPTINNSCAGMRSMPRHLPSHRAARKKHATLKTPIHAREHVQHTPQMQASTNASKHLSRRAGYTQQPAPASPKC